MKTKLFFITSFFLLSTAMLVLFGSTAGCRKTDSASEEVQTNAANRTEEKPLTEAEAKTFAETLETQLRNGNGTFFVRSMDWSRLTDQVLEGVQNSKDLPAEERFDRRALIQLFSEKGGIAQSVAEKIKQGGTYHFLRTRKLPNGNWTVTFRLVDADGGLDYHDLYLERRGGNLIQIYEFYLYHFDETFSETLRRTLVPDLYVDGKNDYGMPMSQLVLILYKENKLLIQELSKAFENGNYNRTLDLFEQLPKELQEQKTFQFWRLKAAQMHPDPSVYSFVLADVRQKFHQEGWVDFLSLDYFFNHHDYANALKCIDRIDQLVGGDPYLQNFRCWAYLNLKQFSEAEKRYAQAVAQEPELTKDASFKSVRMRLDSAHNSTTETPPSDVPAALNPFYRAKP